MRSRDAPARRRARCADRRARQLRPAPARRLRDRRTAPAPSRSNSSRRSTMARCVRCCCRRQDLGAYLPYRRVSFGQETVELGPAGPSPRSFFGLVSIKDYPGQTAPGMFDELLRLPFEMTVSQSFGFVERQAALARMNLALRRMRSAEDEAVSLRADLSNAKDEVAAGRAGFGEHHMTIAVRARHPDAVDDGVAEVQAALADLGIIAVREEIALEPAFWAQFPATSNISRGAAWSRPAISPGSPAATISRSARRPAIIGARRSPCSRRPPPAPIFSTSTRAISAISPSSGRRARARPWCSTSCSPRRASSTRGSSSSTRIAAPSCSSARSAAATIVLRAGHALRAQPAAARRQCRPTASS